MSTSRAAVMFWVLAILIMDSCAAEPDKTLNVTAGTDVLLPCPCDNRSVGVLWQVDLIIVNLAGDVPHKRQSGRILPDESYKKRTNLFWQPTNQNCSLLLRKVSTSDLKIFGCMSYVETAKNENDIWFYYVKLNIEERVTTTEGGPSNQKNVADPTSSPRESHVGVSVGVPLSVIMVILVVLVVALLIRRRRRITTTTVVIQDPKQALPMLKHSPV